MRVREHHGFGHGLRPGTSDDVNCTSCIRENTEGREPVITGTDEAGRKVRSKDGAR